MYEIFLYLILIMYFPDKFLTNVGLVAACVEKNVSHDTFSITVLNIDTYHLKTDLIFTRKFSKVNAEFLNQYYVCL